MDVDAATVERRHTSADPGGHALAGRPRPVRPLGADPGTAAGPSRCAGADHPGRERGLDRLPCPPACCRRAGKGRLASPRRGRRHRAGRSRARMFRRWPDDEDPPRGRARADAAVPVAHCGPPSRQPAVPAPPRTHSRTSRWSRTPATRCRTGPCRQSLRIPREPVLPAQTQNRMHHPGKGRPSTRLQEARLPRRTRNGLRQGRPQGTAHGGVRDQPAETEPRCGHEIRKLAVRHQATVLVATLEEWL